MTTKSTPINLETLEREAFAQSTERLPLNGRDIGPHTWHEIGFRVGVQVGQKLHSAAELQALGKLQLALVDAVKALAEARGDDPSGLYAEPGYARVEEYLREGEAG